jgi:hypothetical protein
MMSYLTLLGSLTLMLSPVLIPLVITGVHAFNNRRKARAQEA